MIGKETKGSVKIWQAHRVLLAKNIQRSYHLHLRQACATYNRMIVRYWCCGGMVEWRMGTFLVVYQQKLFDRLGKYSDKDYGQWPLIDGNRAHVWGQSDNGLVVLDPECVRSTKGDDPQWISLRSFLEEKIVSEYEHYTCAHKSHKILYLDLTITLLFLYMMLIECTVQGRKWRRYLLLSFSLHWTYVGCLGAIKVNGIHLAGMSGIYNYHSYRLGEREIYCHCYIIMLNGLHHLPPHDQSSLQSICHVREYMVIWSISFLLLTHTGYYKRVTLKRTAYHEMKCKNQHTWFILCNSECIQL